MRRETLDELYQRRLEAAKQMPTLTLWRHVKSGGLYRVHDTALSEATLDPVVIYAPEGRPAIRFMRPLSEMLERFERVPE